MTNPDVVLPDALERRMLVERVHATIDLLIANPDASLDADALRQAARALQPRSQGGPERRATVLAAHHAAQVTGFADAQAIADAVEAVANGERDPEMLRDLTEALGAVRRQLADERRAARTVRR